tara:strand:+ start:2444 stop:3523 length:1080 start_codon:yes stop_codon:yes gene_type:complete
VKKKVALVTNIPAPYREKVYELASEDPNIDLTVIYCDKIEKNRNWSFTLGNYKKVFLNTLTLSIFNSYIHLNLKIFFTLNKKKPDVVISCGFGPVMVLSLMWAILNGKKHFIFTDGIADSEESLTYVHQLIRRFFYKNSQGFIAASNKSIKLHKLYGAQDQNIYKSCLCVENEKFIKKLLQEKKFDLMFSGQLIHRKQPLFFIEVAKKVKERLGYCSVLILGDGEMKSEVLLALEQSGLDYLIPGHVDQAALPNFFSDSKLFLFPSSNDPWGVVVNEALASGLPVISSPYPGSSGELVLNEVNGYVIDLDITLWSEKVCELLTSQSKYEEFSEESLNLVKDYNFLNASRGLIDAINNIN